MSPQLRNLLAILVAALLLLGAALWANRPAPVPVSLVSSGLTRCVIDLVSPPPAATCEIDGASLPIPGNPTRWLVFESRGEQAVAGWATDKDAAPGETVVLVRSQASRIAAWPDRQQARRLGFSTAHGYGPSAVAHQGSVTY